MKQASVEESIRFTPPISGRYEWSNGDRTVILIPEMPFVQTNYLGTILASAQDANGNFLDGNFDGNPQNLILDNFNWTFGFTFPNDDFKGAIAGSMKYKSKEQQAQWADRQVYLAMGNALAAAAELRIDTTPMEGFIPAKLDELLGLEAKGLHSVLMLAIGERDEATDYMVNVKKVRTPKSELFVQL